MSVWLSGVEDAVRITLGLSAETWKAGTEGSLSATLPSVLKRDDKEAWLYDNIIVQARGLFTLAHTWGRIENLPDREIKIHVPNHDEIISSALFAAVKDLTSLKGHVIEPAKLRLVVETMPMERATRFHMFSRWKGLDFSSSVDVTDELKSSTAQDAFIEDTMKALCEVVVSALQCAMPLPLIELDKVDYGAGLGRVGMILRNGVPVMLREMLTHPPILHKGAMVRTGLLDESPLPEQERPSRRTLEDWEGITMMPEGLMEKLAEPTRPIFRVGNVELK